MLSRIATKDMKPRTEYDIEAVALSHEVMSTAKRAAAAAGIPIHVWLTRAIMANGATTSSAVAPQAEDPQLLVTNAEKIREALARLTDNDKNAVSEDDPASAASPGGS